MTLIRFFYGKRQVAAGVVTIYVKINTSPDESALCEDLPITETNYSITVCSRVLPFSVAASDVDSPLA